MRSATHPISPIRSKWAAAPTLRSLAMDLITILPPPVDTPCVAWVNNPGVPREAEDSGSYHTGIDNAAALRLTGGLSPDLDS